MTEAITVTAKLINSWADEPNGPVALHLKEKLLPVEGEGGVIFPPTYADIGYSIDTFSDGTKVAQIDSVGSQANRIEPLFKKPPLSALVPQIDIVLGNGKTISILDASHRLGDALVRSTELANEVKEAFKTFQQNGDASPIAKLAPTTLVFGAWDSRGEGAKLPRLVQSTIRAWDIEVLHRAAQYVPPIDYVMEGELEESEDKKESDTRSELGFRHVPAIWRDDARKERHLGGIIARGGIQRDVTVNLVALRALGKEKDQTLRRYVLGLALVAAVEPQDNFLRQGCLLTLDPDSPGVWNLLSRDGSRNVADIDRELVQSYAETAAYEFGVGANRSVKFDKNLARAAIDEKKGGKTKKSAKKEEAGASGG